MIKNLIDIVTIQSLVPALDKFPVIKKFIDKQGGQENWDFFVSSAIWLVLLHDSSSTNTDVRREVEEWKKLNTKIVHNFSQFSTPGVGLEDNIGMWVLWNLKGSSPEAEEAVPIGNFIVKLASDLSSVQGDNKGKYE